MNIIIHQDWDRLPADLQQPYIERVRQAREVRNHKAAQEKMYPAEVAQNEEIDTNSNPSSLWGIGNRDGVVSIDILRDFCSSFSHKSVVKAAAEIEASADPSTLGGCHLPDKDVDYSITQVRSWRSKNMHCAFFHPGLCKTAHQEVFDDVHSLFLQFQKMLGPSLTGAGATLLRFKAGTNAEHNCIVMYYWLCFRLQPAQAGACCLRCPECCAAKRRGAASNRCLHSLQRQRATRISTRAWGISRIAVAVQEPLGCIYDGVHRPDAADGDRTPHHDIGHDVFFCF